MTDGDYWYPFGMPITLSELSDEGRYYTGVAPIPPLGA